MNKESPLDILYHRFIQAFLNNRIGFKPFKIACYLWSINDLTQLTRLSELHLNQ